MKSIAFANRLSRDFETKSFTELSADARLEILDAINGGLGILHSLASHESKTTTTSISLAAPVEVSFAVVQGEAGITGYDFTGDQLYCTIRIDGDNIDNQIIGKNEFLYPYAGSSGTVSATIYGDAVSVPEPYDELVGNPRIVETLREIFPLNQDISEIRRNVGEPRRFRVETNARNQNPPAPSIIRMDCLPVKAYRLTAKFTLAPARVSFADLLDSASSDLPIRAEHIETYLLPICRGLLSSSDLWKNKETKASVQVAATDAAKRYEVFVPRTISTPSNVARTKPGF